MNEDFQRALGCIWSLFGVGFLVGVVVAGGSFRTEVSLELPRVVEVSGEVPFEERLTVRHWLAGLVQGEQADLKEKLGARLRQGEHVTRLTVETKHTFTDLLVSGITLGIYTPETVVVTGRIGRGDEVAAR